MLNTQVGVLSCSGEECLGGTLSRLATRKVMEDLRSGRVVSLCLPLYIAGGQEERDFAKVYPVIAVDGCDKCCAKRATIKYSGEVRDSLIVSELLGEDVALSKNVSARSLKQEHYEMVNQVADEICKRVDQIS
ncbi:putative zinc-binding protein [Desulfitobacterium sp. AusDCA]|uniref:putative zinc-binding protein n=1 Tax=Desulfitobacterium sp. AusDCA TaxID=3240383 RepID=UPI003DA76D55